MYSPCIMSASSRPWRDFVNTQTQTPILPLFPILACHTFDLAAEGLRNSFCRSTPPRRQPLALDLTLAITITIAPPCVASPRFVFPPPWRHQLSYLQCAPCPLPTPHRRPPAGPHSPWVRLWNGEPKGGSARPIPPSLLRHPNLDACLSCLCRIAITDRPMALGEPWPLPLLLADASPEYQLSPSCPRFWFWF